MNAKRKAVFFDVDGTLFQEGKNVPESTIEAIAKIREKGHLAFVCSGRSRVMVPQTPILDIGFDGVVAACGMYASFQDKILFDHQMSQEHLQHILPTMHDTGTMYILEGTEYIYYDEDTIGNAIDDWYIQAIRSLIPDKLIPLPKDFSQIRANKISLQVPPQWTDSVFAKAREKFSLLLHVGSIGELVPLGYSKSGGIQKVCRILDVPMENTIAVGDSINDVDMLRGVALGIAMGNATSPAKENADYITTDINEDGIWNAMKYAGLL